MALNITMLELFKYPVRLSIFIFLILCFVLIVTKPRVFFDEEGSIKPFGCEHHATLFSLPVCILWIAIVITFFCEYMHLK